MRQLITVSVDAGLKKRLESYAKKHKMNRSELVKNAIQRYLNIQEFDELRQRFVPLAEKASYFTDEDVFREKD